MDSKNKKPGLTEIIIGILIFVGFPYVGNFLSNFFNPDLPSFGYLLYFAYILGLVLFLIGLVKILKNKKNINVQDSSIITKKQNPVWLFVSLILIIIGFVIFYLGKIECRESPAMFCGLGHVAVMIPFVGIGVFITFIYFIRKITKHK